MAIVLFLGGVALLSTCSSQPSIPCSAKLPDSVPVESPPMQKEVTWQPFSKETPMQMKTRWPSFKHEQFYGIQQAAVGTVVTPTKAGKKRGKETQS